MSEDTFIVKAFRPEIIEAGTYPATLVGMKKRPGSFGEDYVQWIFQPNGYSENVQPAGATSMAAGATAKGMEWARRMLGKSDAVDMKWGRDLKEKRPVVDWGPDILIGKSCRIVVEKNYDDDDDEERYRNRVVNVLPPEETKVEKDTADEEDADFNDIPF